MSFASEEGTGIGQLINYTFGENDILTINNTEEAFSQIVAHGTFVVTCNFNIYSLPVVSNNTMGAQAIITYNGTVIAQQRFHSETDDSLSVTGILFSDGLSSLRLTISGNNKQGETARLWGYSEGSIKLIRLTH